MALYECPYCHKEFPCRVYSINKGHTRSCGCQKYIKKNIWNKTSINNIWRQMRNRCYNTNSPDYPSYGAIGITMCEKWLKFEGFLEDMGDRPGKEYSVDRIDNTKGYSKENCRWATAIEQANNRKNSKYIEYKGEIKTIAEWARLYNIKYATLLGRLKNKWSIEEVFTTPIRQSTCR